MENYTPGPWTVDTYSPHGKIDAFMIVAPDNSIPNIGSVFGREDEALANATLISAAHELLEACREAEKWGDLWHHNKIKLDSAPWISSVKKAIKKATLHRLPTARHSSQVAGKDTASINF